MTVTARRKLAAGTAIALVLAANGLSGNAQAQDAPAAEAPEATESPIDAYEISEEVVVLGRIAYRNRVNTAAPVLKYGLDYFQRFEPLTAGDALKRVPSVTFLSDVLESDGARMRGLAPAYTQILIDGERVPGAGVDRSFFVDRIPAELIESVEIVRGSSANRSGDAIAGTINIKLRDSYALDGGFVRGGLMYFDDGEFRETFGGVWGGEVGAGRLLIGANMQDRYNPKVKGSLRFDEPPAVIGNFDNREDQTDTRDGTDWSANATYIVPVASGELTLAGFYVYTDRTQSEHSIEYTERFGTAPTTILTDNTQIVEIESVNWSLKGGWEGSIFDAGETRIKFGFARYEDDITDNEEDIEFLRDATPFPEADRFTGDLVLTDITDDEFTAKLEQDIEFETFVLELGLHYQLKTRETLILEDRNRFNLPGGTVPPISPGAYTPVPALGGDSDLEERRLDPYVMLSGETGNWLWEAGLRLETTNFELTDRTAPTPGEVNQSSDYTILLPSLNVKYNLSDDARLQFSAGRTVRRPGFDELSPALLEEEVGEMDFQGNPLLEPETAWGFDFGYERRIGERGVAGVNFFYRSVEDLIETVNTGVPGPNTDLLSVANVGDGEVWGIEFDLSAPLTFIGMENTGVFINYSWLDSTITDFMGDRRFNDQSDFVFNAGFIHDLPEWGAAFGATYRKQGDAFGRIIGEEVETTYGADLEVFVEKRFGESVTVRLTGSNLLNATKDEVFHKFDTEGDQVARDYDEFELETEEAGPVFQLIVRAAF